MELKELNSHHQEQQLKARLLIYLNQLNTLIKEARQPNSPLAPALIELQAQRTYLKEIKKLRGQEFIDSLAFLESFLLNTEDKILKIIEATKKEQNLVKTKRLLLTQQALSTKPQHTYFKEGKNKKNLLKEQHFPATHIVRWFQAKLEEKLKEDHKFLNKLEQKVRASEGKQTPRSFTYEEKKVHNLEELYFAVIKLVYLKNLNDPTSKNKLELAKVKAKIQVLQTKLNVIGLPSNIQLGFAGINIHTAYKEDLYSPAELLRTESYKLPLWLRLTFIGVPEIAILAACAGQQPPAVIETVNQEDAQPSTIPTKVIEGLAETTSTPDVKKVVEDIIDNATKELKGGRGTIFIIDGQQYLKTTNYLFDITIDKNDNYQAKLHIEMLKNEATDAVKELYSFTQFYYLKQKTFLGIEADGTLIILKINADSKFEIETITNKDKIIFKLREDNDREDNGNKKYRFSLVRMEQVGNLSVTKDTATILNALEEYGYGIKDNKIYSHNGKEIDGLIINATGIIYKNKTTYRTAEIDLKKLKEGELIIYTTYQEATRGNISYQTTVEGVILDPHQTYTTRNFVMDENKHFYGEDDVSQLLDAEGNVIAKIEVTIRLDRAIGFFVNKKDEVLYLRNNQLIKLPQNYSKEWIVTDEAILNKEGKILYIYNETFNQYLVSLESAQEVFPKVDNIVYKTDAYQKPVAYALQGSDDLIAIFNYDTETWQDILSTLPGDTRNRLGAELFTNVKHFYDNNNYILSGKKDFPIINFFTYGEKTNGKKLTDNLYIAASVDVINRHITIDGQVKYQPMEIPIAIYNKETDKYFLIPDLHPTNPIYSMDNLLSIIADRFYFDGESSDFLYNPEQPEHLPEQGRTISAVWSIGQGVPPYFAEAITEEDIKNCYENNALQEFANSGDAKNLTTKQGSEFPVLFAYYGFSR